MENIGTGAPTVILAKTIKGWTLGEGFEGRNATHQIKKMTKAQLVALRDRLFMQDEIPADSIEADDPPYFRPAEDSIEYQYMMERRKALGGSLPKRTTKARKPLTVAGDSTFAELRGGSGKQEASTTMGFTRLLRTLARDKDMGPRVVPIVPDEARTFGMDALFRELNIYASMGQKYEPVDHDLLLSYSESAKGQILEEGITEAGSMSSFIAAGTSYATHGVPMVPFYTFYSMFGFQRVGDLIWQAADQRAPVGSCSARRRVARRCSARDCSTRTATAMLLASTVPACQAYDPAYAYEVATIVQAGLQRMYGADVADDERDVFYYLALYNENYAMPPMPDFPDIADEIVKGLYRWAEAPDDTGHRATILFSGSAQGAAAGGCRASRQRPRRRRRVVVGHQLQAAA